MIYKWNYELPSPEVKTAEEQLALEVGVHPALGHLLTQRGFTTAQEAKRFFRPQLADLHDPFLMNDMQEAVDRLNEAMIRKERIMATTTWTEPLLLRWCISFCANIILM